MYDVDTIKRCFEKYAFDDFHRLMEIYYSDNVKDAVNAAISPELLSNRYIDPKEKNAFVKSYHTDSDVIAFDASPPVKDLTTAMMIGAAFEVRYFFHKQLSAYPWGEKFHKFIDPLKPLLLKLDTAIQDALVNAVFHLHDCKGFSKFMESCYSDNLAEQIVKRSISREEVKKKYGSDSRSFEDFYSLYKYSDAVEKGSIKSDNSNYNKEYNSQMLASLLCSAFEARYVNNPTVYYGRNGETISADGGYYDGNIFIGYALGESFYSKKYSKAFSKEYFAYDKLQSHLKKIADPSITNLLSDSDKVNLVRSVFYGHDVHIFKRFMDAYFGKDEAKNFVGNILSAEEVRERYADCDKSFNKYKEYFYDKGDIDSNYTHNVGSKYGGILFATLISATSEKYLFFDSLYQKRFNYLMKDVSISDKFSDDIQKGVILSYFNMHYNFGRFSTFVDGCYEDDENDNRIGKDFVKELITLKSALWKYKLKEFNKFVQSYYGDVPDNKSKGLISKFKSFFRSADEEYISMDDFDGVIAVLKSHLLVDALSKYSYKDFKKFVELYYGDEDTSSRLGEVVLGIKCSLDKGNKIDGIGSFDVEYKDKSIGIPQKDIFEFILLHSSGYDSFMSFADKHCTINSVTALLNGSELLKKIVEVWSTRGCSCSWRIIQSKLS